MLFFPFGDAVVCVRLFFVSHSSAVHLGLIAAILDMVVATPAFSKMRYLLHTKGIKSDENRHQLSSTYKEQYFVNIRIFSIVVTKNVNQHRCQVISFFRWHHYRGALLGLCLKISKKLRICGPETAYYTMAHNDSNH